MMYTEITTVCSEIGDDNDDNDDDDDDDDDDEMKVNAVGQKGTINNDVNIIVDFSFIVEPCVDTISINSNQLMHISIFIKNTLKFYLKFLLPRHVSDHIGIHPQGAIIRS